MTGSFSARSGVAVAVFGAYGHTGQFIVTELERRGLRPILCGRDSTRLAALAAADRGRDWRVAHVDRPESLDAAFAGAAAVINAAGPFMDTATPILEAALRARIHYLDTSAEQRAALAVFEQFADRVRNAGVVATPSVAFYGALADLLATAAFDDWHEADRIDIAVGLDSWHPTQGTRLTGQRNHGVRWIVEGGTLVPQPDAAPDIAWVFPEPLGAQDVVMLSLSETILISRHLRCDQVHSYMNVAPLRDLRDPDTPPPAIDPVSGRSTQQFVVDVRVTNCGTQRRAIAHGQDIYAVSAPLIVEALQRILDGQAPGPGCWPVAQAFNARSFLDALAPEHLTWKIAM